MPDCFISYCRADEKFATHVYKELRLHRLTAFLARLSLRPGQNWTEEVWRNLRGSGWFLFLASKKACKSAYVQQELGGALAAQKTLIPIVWDIDPSELPGWMNQKHALDLRGHSVEQIRQKIEELADEFRSRKTKGNLVALGVVGGLLLLAAATASE